MASDPLFAPESIASTLSESWIRTSSSAAVSDDGAFSSDAAITHLAIMGIWMGRNCRGITNNTDAIFQLDGRGDAGGSIGQGYTASISRASNTMMVNGVTGGGPGYAVRKHVRFWGREGRQAGMDIVREVRVLTHEPIRRHPNIISLIAFEWMFWPGVEPGVSPVLCLEFSELGDLASFQRDHQLSYKAKRKIFLDAATGLAALHDSGVVHGDVKSENLLVFQREEGYHVKLCDFGFAVFLADVKGDTARLVGGTSPWTAPEFRRDLPYPHHFLKLTDVYSLGLLVWRVLLDGASPFDHALLESFGDVEQLKVAEPPLLHFAQALILLRPEYAPSVNEICSLLACTLQRQPLKRKLRTAIRIASQEARPMPPRAAAQLTSNPLAFTDGFNIKNICVPVRLRLIKHLRTSAIQMGSDPDWKAEGSGENRIVRGLIDVALGDGGLDLDDDPAEALKWITQLAKEVCVPMQAIIVRMYDYFDQPMPLEVQREANNYLANGVINGSVTACLDYATYWPKLKFQTQSSPEDLFFSARTFYANGAGFPLDQHAAELQDIDTLSENMKAMGGESATLRQLYSLNRGNTLLHGCAMLGLPEAAQLLLGGFNADVNARNDNGDTPLLLACRNGKFPMILKLVARGARADIPNNQGETPLHWVLNIPNETFEFNGMPANRLLLAIDMLLYGRGSLQAQAAAWGSRAELYRRLCWAAGTPLHRAVSRRNLDAARALLLKRADPTSLDGGEERLTPIDLAMHHHNAPMLGLLLDSCTFDPNTVYPDGHTLYSRAIASVTTLEMITIHGKAYPQAVHDTLDLLLARGFDLTRAKIDRAGTSSEWALDALFVAVFYERLAWAQYLLSSKPCMALLDINRANGEFDMTPLHQAIHDRRKSIFVALLDAGADPARTCSTCSVRLTGIDMKTTSLHLVAQQGDPDLFFTTRLLASALDVDAGDFSGTTPLACAVIEGNLHIANALLEHGADINKRMGPSQAKPEVRDTVLAKILSRDCGLVVNRLNYLLADPDEDGDDHVDPALRRHGPAAGFMVKEGTSALHYFLRAHGSREDTPFRTCLQILLKAFPRSSQLDYRDREGQTPLHVAAAHANVFAVSALLGAGATASLSDGEGRTPGDIAGEADCGDEDTKRRLLDMLSRT